MKYFAFLIFTLPYLSFAMEQPSNDAAFESLSRMDQTAVDISYLQTPNGQNQLEHLNNSLEQHLLHMQIEQQDDHAVFRISFLNLNENNTERVELASIRRRLATDENRGLKITEKTLPLLARYAIALSNKKEIVVPVVKNYYNNRDFSTKMRSRWDNSILPEIKAQASQHFGEHFSKFIFDYFEISEIPESFAQTQRAHAQAENNFERQEPLINTMAQLGELLRARKTTAQNEEKFITLYEQLVLGKSR